MFEIDAIKRRFLALNHERLKRTRETIRSRQRDVMDLLPLLFHINHASFPGFVSTETPAGISEYTPTKNSIDAGKKIVRNFSFQRKALLRYDIHSMFLMGSCGSIAYNTHSDFDIWLCHRPDLEDEQLKLLQHKASEIETWAESFGLEVHFFLMDADKFRDGENVDLSAESSGSAQHHLLLEEFYRTSLLFAGRYPLWWLVPPEEEANYKSYARNLIHRRFVRESEIIDFGGMPSGLEQEFFGAALWQLYKGVDSPYKAALKLLLMETYASEHPNTDLLCMRFKKAVYNGEKNIEVLDPYIMLYRKIEAHLATLNDNDRLSLIQRCFYFKVAQQLGEHDTVANQCWQRDAMNALTQEWGWDKGYVSMLDHRDEWKIARVLDEKKILVEALTNSYKRLSDFARQSTKLSDINQKDLHVLGRKLYAAFERKAGKVEIVNRGISKNVWESHITLHQSGTGDNNGWSLFPGTVYSEDIASTKPLKRSHNIIDLVTWCYLNKLIDQRTSIAVYTQDSTITLNDIKAIIRSLGEMFPSANLIQTRMDDLIKSPRVVKGNIFVNIGNDPSRQRLSQGMTLTSDKTDAFSYSGIDENLVLSLDLVVQNSWQEVVAYHFEGEQGILDCIGAYMQISPPGQGMEPPAINSYCFTTGRGMTIAARVQEMFDDVINCYYKKSAPDTSRYVMLIGKAYHVINYQNDAYSHQLIGGINKLLHYLSKPSKRYSPVRIDRYALAKSPLPVMFKNNKENYIQIYYSVEGKNIDVYVLDEKGSLFHQNIKNTDEKIFISQYGRFLEAVINKRNLQLNIEDSSAGNSISFYQLVKNKSGEIRIIPREFNVRDSNKYFNLNVIADINKSRQSSYTLYCNDKEYTSMEYGDKIFQEVARDVSILRKNNTYYPIHITDIEFSRPQIDKEPMAYMQTIYFLNYKRGIEDRLYQALVNSDSNYDHKAQA